MPDLSTEQQRILDNVDRLAELLDARFEIPYLGYKFGLDSVLGLIPTLGDALSAAIAMYIVWAGYRLGASATSLVRMVGNVALDTALGSIPGVGHVFDLAYRPNLRNVALIHRELGI